MINLTVFRTFYLTDNLLILYIFHIQYQIKSKGDQSLEETVKLPTENCRLI